MMQYIDDPLLILTQLINNKEYFNKIMHHIKQEYFEFELDRRIFKFIKSYSAHYSEAPKPLIVKNALSKLDITNDEHIQYVNEFVELIDKAEIIPLQPLLDKTELFIKDMALKQAINQSISIYKGETNEKPDAIPELVKTALAVSIEENHGQLYFSREAAEQRRKNYNNPELKIPFLLNAGNDVTNGGVSKQSLHCIAAAPNVGKTAMLLSLASDYVETGKNVLYVTCEMSEDQIGVRFDARFLNRETAEIPKIDEEFYFEELEKLESQYGKLIIKGFPTNELTALQLEVLLDELYTTLDFKPDVVLVDYLGICSSYYLKDRGNIGTYYTKVAEEFRACAQKKDFALWTAQQMTTDALDNTDPTLKHIGYGQGIAKTADMVWFAIRTEELDSLGQILIKQDKTRYHKERVVRFVIGFDFGRMKFYNVDSASIPMNIAVGKKTQEEIKEISKQKISTAFNDIGKKKNIKV